MSRRSDLLNELAGAECACGSPKIPRQSFCRACYYLLPPRLRRPLYKRIGEGYEQAYDEAAAFLRSRALKDAKLDAGGLSADMRRRGYK